jgi:ribosomal protein S18 acetylase RimI-like enzyme
MTDSIFSYLVDYINSKPVGEIIYRKDLHMYVSNSTAIDVYRRRLSLLGYLSVGLANGQYEKLKDIPENFTSTESEYAYKNKRIKLNKNARVKKN